MADVKWLHRGFEVCCSNFCGTFRLWPVLSRSNLMRAQSVRFRKCGSGKRCSQAAEAGQRISRSREGQVYRSDVVGSLLRPAYLKEARDRHEAGQLSEAEFKRTEDRAVDEAIALQEH